jgi:endonuclease YncB( thermonuclease family)
MRLLVFFITIAVSFSEVLGGTLIGTVTSVYDGDTITLNTEAGNKKIRLAGIDAPEIKQPYGLDSRDALRQDVLNQPVTVDTTKQDKYGRSVGKVLIDGEDINLKQVSRGLAWVYVKYLVELTADDRLKYQTAQKAAQQGSLGMWSSDNLLEPWNYRALVTRNK